MDKSLVVKTLFNFFYLKFYGYQPSFSQKEDKMVDNFLNKLHKIYGVEGLGVNFFIDYSSFAWNYWLGNTEGGSPKRKVKIGWIVGPKMIDRWLNKKDHYSNSYEYRLYSKINTNKSKIRSELESLFSVDGQSDLSIAEENEKVRFENSLAQLYHCLMNTSMFNSKSIHCLVCKEKIRCKNISLNGINTGLNI